MSVTEITGLWFIRYQLSHFCYRSDTDGGGVTRSRILSFLRSPNGGTIKLTTPLLQMKIEKNPLNLTGAQTKQE